MSIQVSQVKGDVVELIFNPREEDLRVGETLRIQERDSGEGLVVQVVAFRMVTYPSLIQEQLELVIGNAQPLSRELLTYLSEAQETLQEYDTSEARNLKIAIAKIRKLTGRRWDQWDGWIPIRDVEVTGYRIKSYLKIVLMISAIRCISARRSGVSRSLSRGITWRRSTSSRASKGLASPICPKLSCWS